MDSVRAKKTADDLKGTEIGGWEILDYINHGKSAVVLKAEKDGEEAALKVFDDELIERFGKKKQLIRVEREKELIGKSHPNLIEIIDGGECRTTGHIYLVMGYLPWRNLSQVLSELPRDIIFPLIQQIASAAKHLEESGLAHRDIKPENIAISDDFSQAILLDLGVLRPVGLSEITDDNDQKAFVGTLRYSPPELLYRKEADTENGWRAITFYQIGAVLHDMIMKQPIFYDHSEPWAKLVDAVKDEAPDIKADDIDSEIILIVKSCLVKDPEARLSLINWDKLTKPIHENKTVDSFRDRIERRNQIIRSRNKECFAKDTNLEYRLFKNLEHVINEIKKTFRDICLDDKECFPRFEINHYLNDSNTEASILICFSRSEYHHLFITGTLHLNISISSQPDEIITVGFRAIASCDSKLEKPFEISDFTSLYRGKYDQNLIQKRIKCLLFEFIDACQECGEIKNEKPVLLKIGIEI